VPIGNDTAIPVNDAELTGSVSRSPDMRGVVIFAHGSGSSRHSPRNRMVARRLNQAGFATVLLDLLTAEEEEVDRLTAQQRFDIELLAGRLVSVIDWADSQPDLQGRPVGLFGASTGAAAALVAAARRPQRVRAVVSRGGRPDLAGADLAAVRAPTLLLVGGYDPAVLELNQQAADVLGGYGSLVVIPRATHLFSEPGALEQVAEWATQWFDRQLGK
jgi:putative phosphoribosyl transferase